MVRVRSWFGLGFVLGLWSWLRLALWLWLGWGLGAWGLEGGLVFGVGAGAGSVLVMRLGLGGEVVTVPVC